MDNDYVMLIAVRDTAIIIFGVIMIYFGIYYIVRGFKKLVKRSK